MDIWKNWRPVVFDQMMGVQGCKILILVIAFHFFDSGGSVTDKRKNHKAARMRHFLGNYGQNCF